MVESAQTIAESLHARLLIESDTAQDAVWSYEDPLPDCPRIKEYLCFYPEKAELQVEGNSTPAR
jgi:uncharacterized protein (DUF427 family)